MTDATIVDAAADGAAIPIHAVAPEGLSEAAGRLPAPARKFLEAAGFKAAAGAVLLLPGADGAVAAVLFGLGKAGSPERTPLLAGKLANALPPGTYRLGDGFADPALAVLGFGLGAYRFRRYRKAEDAGEVKLAMPEGVDAVLIRRTIAAISLARDLINTPANEMGPRDLEAAIRDVAAAHKADVAVTPAADLLARGFPLVFAVGAAATPERGPRLVDFTWGSPAAPKVTLVGKGVCFDTGGLDIKPSANMLLMKKDMGGAANALALAIMIMGAGLDLRLRLLVPAVENAVSGGAMRPGDILQSRKGLTVEIGNTDAEGRLILADALTLASEEKPELLIDFATLTGAARVALGPDLPAIFTGGDNLAAEVARHAAATSDPVWRMPLWSPYMAMLDSKVADINNAGSGGFAGAITAALFLSRFVADQNSWLHVDLFAWNQAAKPGQPEGGEAQTIRALYSLLSERYPARR